MSPMPGNTREALQPRPAQLAILDACRGAAALWVVIFHASVAYVVNGHTDLLANPLYALSVQGQIGVGFFFVISGYCILATICNGMSRGSTLQQYFAARIKRIYPPYLVALFCVVLTRGSIVVLMSHGFLQGARPPASPFDRGIGSWLANMALVQYPGEAGYLSVAWSLCYEVAFYLLAGILWWLAMLARKNNHRTALLVTLLNVCSLVSLVWFSTSRSTCPFPLDRWYQFGLGMAMFVLINARRMQLGRFLQAQSIVLILATLAHAWSSSAVTPEGGFFSDRTLVLCVLGFVACVTMLARFDHVLAGHWVVVQLRKLGTISYSLYLFHMIPMPIVDAVMRRLGFEGSLYVVCVAAQTATAVITGALFYRLVEKRFADTKKRPVEALPLQCQPSI